MDIYQREKQLRSHKPKSPLLQSNILKSNHINDYRVVSLAAENTLKGLPRVESLRTNQTSADDAFNLFLDDLAQLSPEEPRNIHNAVQSSPLLRQNHQRMAQNVQRFFQQYGVIDPKGDPWSLPLLSQITDPTDVIDVYPRVADIVRDAKIATGHQKAISNISVQLVKLAKKIETDTEFDFNKAVEIANDLYDQIRREEKMLGVNLAHFGSGLLERDTIDDITTFIANEENKKEFIGALYNQQRILSSHPIQQQLLDVDAYYNDIVRNSLSHYNEFSASTGGKSSDFLFQHDLPQVRAGERITSQFADKSILENTITEDKNRLELYRRALSPDGTHMATPMEAMELFYAQGHFVDGEPLIQDGVSYRELQARSREIADDTIIKNLHDRDAVIRLKGSSTEYVFDPNTDIPWDMQRGTVRLKARHIDLDTLDWSHVSVEDLVDMQKNLREQTKRRSAQSFLRGQLQAANVDESTIQEYLNIQGQLESMTEMARNNQEFDRELSELLLGEYSSLRKQINLQSNRAVQSNNLYQTVSDRYREGVLSSTRRSQVTIDINGQPTDIKRDTLFKILSGQGVEFSDEEPAAISLYQALSKGVREADYDTAYGHQAIIPPRIWDIVERHAPFAKDTTIDKHTLEEMQQQAAETFYEYAAEQGNIKLIPDTGAANQYNLTIDEEKFMTHFYRRYFSGSKQKVRDEVAAQKLMSFFHNTFGDRDMDFTDFQHVMDDVVQGASINLEAFEELVKSGSAEDKKRAALMLQFHDMKHYQDFFDLPLERQQKVFEEVQQFRHMQGAFSVEDSVQDWLNYHHGSGSLSLDEFGEITEQLYDLHDMNLDAKDFGSDLLSDIQSGMDEQDAMRLMEDLARQQQGETGSRYHARRVGEIIEELYDTPLDQTTTAENLLDELGDIPNVSQYGVDMAALRKGVREQDYEILGGSLEQASEALQAQRSQKRLFLNQERDRISQRIQNLGLRDRNLRKIVYHMRGASPEEVLQRFNYQTPPDDLLLGIRELQDTYNIGDELWSQHVVEQQFEYMRDQFAEHLQTEEGLEDYLSVLINQSPSGEGVLDMNIDGQIQSVAAVRSKSGDIELVLPDGSVRRIGEQEAVDVTVNRVLDGHSSFPLDYSDTQDIQTIWSEEGPVQAPLTLNTLREESMQRRSFRRRNPVGMDSSITFRNFQSLIDGAPATYLDIETTGLMDDDLFQMLQLAYEDVDAGVVTQKQSVRFRLAQEISDGILEQSNTVSRQLSEIAKSTGEFEAAKALQSANIKTDDLQRMLNVAKFADGFSYRDMKELLQVDSAEGLQGRIQQLVDATQEGLTQFTAEAGAVDMDDFLRGFARDIQQGKRILVGQNIANFDYPALRNAISKSLQGEAGIEDVLSYFEQAPLIETEHLARLYMHSSDAFTTDESFVFYNLDEQVKRMLSKQDYEAFSSGAHDALVDTDYMRQVVEAYQDAERSYELIPAGETLQQGDTLIVDKSIGFSKDVSRRGVVPKDAYTVMDIIDQDDVHQVRLQSTRDGAVRIVSGRTHQELQTILADHSFVVTDEMAGLDLTHMEMITDDAADRTFRRAQTSSRMWRTYAQDMPTSIQDTAEYQARQRYERFIDTVESALPEDVTNKQRLEAIRSTMDDLSDTDRWWVTQGSRVSDKKLEFMQDNIERGVSSLQADYRPELASTLKKQSKHFRPFLDEIEAMEYAGFMSHSDAKKNTAAINNQIMQNFGKTKQHDFVRKLSVAAGDSAFDININTLSERHIQQSLTTASYDFQSFLETLDPMQNEDFLNQLRVTGQDNKQYYSTQKIQQYLSAQIKSNFNLKGPSTNVMQTSALLGQSGLLDELPLADLVDLSEGILIDSADDEAILQGIVDQVLSPYRDRVQESQVLVAGGNNAYVHAQDITQHSLEQQVSDYNMIRTIQQEAGDVPLSHLVGDTPIMESKPDFLPLQHLAIDDPDFWTNPLLQQEPEDIMRQIQRMTKSIDMGEVEEEALAQLQKDRSTLLEKLSDWSNPFRQGRRDGQHDPNEFSSEVQRVLGWDESSDILDTTITRGEYAGHTIGDVVQESLADDGRALERLRDDSKRWTAKKLAPMKNRVDALMSQYDSAPGATIEQSLDDSLNVVRQKMKQNAQSQAVQADPQVVAQTLKKNTSKAARDQTRNLNAAVKSMGRQAMMGEALPLLGGLAMGAFALRQLTRKDLVMPDREQANAVPNEGHNPMFVPEGVHSQEELGVRIQARASGSDSQGAQRLQDSVRQSVQKALGYPVDMNMNISDNRQSFSEQWLDSTFANLLAR